MKARRKISGPLTAGMRMLKKLSESLGLDVKVWQNGELVQVFRCSNAKSRKINLDFKEIGKNQGRWSLKKRKKKKGCLLRLVADEVRQSPFSLLGVLQVYQPQDYQPYNPTRGVGGAGELLNKSHGALSMDEKMCHPRRSASYGLYGRSMSKGDLTFPKCIDGYSKKLGHHGFLMGFSSFNQQSYFLHEVMLSPETQGTLKHLMNRDDPNAWVRQILPVETFHGTLSGLTKGPKPSLMGNIFYGGEKIGDAPIEFVSLTLKHAKPTQFQNAPKILVHDFYPILYRFDNPQHIFQGTSSKDEKEASPEKKVCVDKGKVQKRTSPKRNGRQNPGGARKAVRKC